MLVPGSVKQVVLESLQPDTRYSIMVTAEYRSREGGSASAQGKTSESDTIKEHTARLNKCKITIIEVETVMVTHLW